MRKANAERIPNRLDLGESWHAAGDDGRGLNNKKEPLHISLCNGSFAMLLQVHHAADLGGGGGDGA